MEALEHKSAQRSRLRAPLGDERGFTLIELLTVMATLIVVLLASLAMFEVVQRTQPEISERNDAIQTAQIEMERLVQDLRQAYDVVTATSTTLTVLTYDNKATCASATAGDSRACRVTYTCASGTCTRTAAESDGSAPGTARTLLDGLASDAVFTYSPSTSSPTTVFVRLEMESDDGAAGEDLITLEEGVTMRNVAVGGA
jgi:type II secretory pathway pseudopilin PulG